MRGGSIATVGCVLAIAACSPAGPDRKAQVDDSDARVLLASLAPLGPIEPEKLPAIDAQLGIAPQAAPPTGRSAPARVVVKLETREVVKELADGSTRSGRSAAACPDR
jgi:hypothetical protein